MGKSVLQIYNKRKKKYEKLVEKQNKYINFISNLRLIVFILGVIFLLISLVRKNYLFSFGIVLFTSILFFYLVNLFEKISVNKKYSVELYKINEISIKRLNGQWTKFKDTGSEYINKNHNYSHDLDIFGRESLFQWINTTCTYLGREKLKNALTRKPKDKNILISRQNSAIELSKKLYFRQRFQAEGKIINHKDNNLEVLLSWLKRKNRCILDSKMIYFIMIIPIITTLTSIILVARIIKYLMIFILNINVNLPEVFKIVPFYVPILLISIQFVILIFKREDRLNSLSIIEKYRDDIKIYRNILKLIEKSKFKSPYLINLCKSLHNSKSISSFKQIDLFSKISDIISNRHNMIYPILNVILMLEYRWYIRLEKWKMESGVYFNNWIDILGEIDYLCSISNVKYDNPEWVIPTVNIGDSKFTAKNMAHPLLKDKVYNNLELREPKSIILITGSNMSGKSTLMRTVGINIILAYAGAAVCANEFHCTVMDIYSCMKISDNLNKNISSFYAEMLKIKNITKASKEGKHVFFLLDEIFKGTNSIDRHTGAMVLIKQLSKKGNLGLISTHDLELSEMENIKDSKVKNYHFSEYYKDNKIYFDYKLKLGVSTTRNAIYLMKMAGIDISLEK